MDTSFVLPKFQGQFKSVLHGIFSLEKRTKFLNDYMNALIVHNTSENLKLLLSCTLFTDFIDLISKFILPFGFSDFFFVLLSFSLEWF